MAAEHELTPTSYIGHHLSFLQHPVGEGPFWTLNVDSLATSALLGIASLGFLWWVVRGATSGVPNKRQAFVERSEEHTSELQSLTNLVCRLLLEKKNHPHGGGNSVRFGLSIINTTGLEFWIVRFRRLFRRAQRATSHW